MTDQGSLEAVAERWLASLQQDLKDFVHVVCDDLELDDELRTLAIGAVLYGLIPGDVVPDSQGVLGYFDDALALRVALLEIRDKAPDRWERFADRVPELCDTLGDDLTVFSDALGDVWEPFRDRVRASASLEFKGKKASDLLDADGAAWLEDEVSELALKLGFKEPAIAAAARKATSVIPLFRQKLSPQRR